MGWDAPPMACFKTRVYSGVQRMLTEGSCTSSSLQPNRDNQSRLCDSNPCTPQQPLVPANMGRGSRRGSPRGLKVTTVSIPSMPRPFQAKAWHRVPGTVGRAGIPLCEECGRVRGQLRKPYRTLLAFPVVLRGAKWVSCSSPALRGGTGWGIGIAFPWLLR